jgi:lysozyme family protein
MADFEQAIRVVLAHEGAFSADPADPGGATNWGISSRAYPGLDVRALTRDDAKALYRRDYWTPHGYGTIADQALATKVFDLAVNMGPRQANRVLQRAANRLGAQLEDDGVIGPHTLAAVHACDAAVLLDLVKVQAAQYYLSLNQPRFERGWLRRALA